MENKRKIFLTIIVTITFSIVFSGTLSTSGILLYLFPESNSVFFNNLLDWGIRLVISAFFVMKFGIVERIMPNWGIKLLVVCVSIFALLVVLLSISLIFSEQLVLIFSYLLLITHQPTKILLTVGVLKALLSLKTDKNIVEQTNNKISQFIVVLGFAVFFQQIFPQFSGSFGMILPKIVIFGVGLNWVIFLLIAYFFVRQTKIYQRLLSNDAIKLLAVAIIASIVVQVIYGQLLDGNIFITKEDGITGLLALDIARLVAGVTLAVGILKIFLSLKPATHVEYHRNNS